MIHHQLEDSTQVAQGEPAWPYSCNLGASPGAVDDMADQDQMMMQFHRIWK
jgi:hypothetical protein